MYDVLSLSKGNLDCLDKGHVSLIDVMPRLCPEGQTADHAIVQAARVSYGTGTKTVNEDRGLIRYLLRHNHTTPFEMVEFKFRCKLPIMAARQMIRHRTANVNEYSGRYSVMSDEFYIPNEDNVREQSKANKQGGESAVSDEVAQQFINALQTSSDRAYKDYEKSLADGISREQARMILPVNLYTEWYWKVDAHNLLHFLALRCDSHAQMEIRVFAEAMLELISPIIPTTIEAWNDYHYHRQAIKLTRLEVDALRELLKGKNLPTLNSDNKREQAEWMEKAARLGLGTKE